MWACVNNRALRETDGVICVMIISRQKELTYVLSKNIDQKFASAPSVEEKYKWALYILVCVLFSEKFLLDQKHADTF